MKVILHLNSTQLLSFRLFLALHTVKKYIFLRACLTIPHYIAKLKVFSQSQSQIPQAFAMIIYYQSQVKNIYWKSADMYRLISNLCMNRAMCHMQV